jgi:prepilin-type N-terminal cleavage/methylation domain-containing protein
MKVESFRRPAAGFTLVELVVVMAIIVVLAGLAIGLRTTIRSKENITKTKLQVALLENALADYQFDHGAYPSSLDAEGRKGDEVLYKHLYHDGVEAREAGAASPKIYLAALEPETNSKSGQAWIQGKGAEARIVDPWGESYRYRSGDAPNALNPDFDLWSCGPDGKTNVDPKHAACMNDITSWDN